MAGLTQDIIVVAQAEGGDALQQGEVVALRPRSMRPSGAAAANTLPPAETHAGTEAHSEVFPPFDPARPSVASCCGSRSPSGRSTC